MRATDHGYQILSRFLTVHPVCELFPDGQRRDSTHAVGAGIGPGLLTA
jgi:hypothetical protein